ncbi:reverse transcriptase domain-containing protein [Tanacetum coccineum]
MEDQPLPADASPTALSPGYIVDSDPEEDEGDPEEDPADYPADGGDNDDDESSDDDDDDDVEKDEEDEHLAPADPSVACITKFVAALPSSLPPPPENIKSLKDNIRETMTTVNQGMSVEEIKRVIAQRVANAIKAIAIYEMKTNMARKSLSQTERQEDKVAENASNKRKWEGNHNVSSSQKHKGHKVPRAYTTWPINKKAYAGSLPLCNQSKFHHNGPCTIKCKNYKKVGHIIQNCKTPATTRNQRIRTCYEYGSLRHYKSECLIVKFHKRVDMIREGVRASKPKTMQDAIEFVTKLMDKKISTPAKRQAENKRKAYIVGHGEKKHYGGSKPLCSKCNYHHDGTCAPKCHKCNRVGHLARDCRSSTNANTANNQRSTRASQKATCYEFGNQGHYRNDCPERKNQNHENQTGVTGARGVVHAFGGGETEQDLNNIED